MYTKLIVHRNNTKRIEYIEEALNNIGHMVFNRLSEDLEYSLRNARTPDEFIKTLFFINRSYTTARFSNRYQRFVNSGNAGRNTNTNRSIVDMFLLAKYYKPEYANMELLYNTLMHWWMTDVDFQQQICSTIHRRVWFYRGPFLLSQMLKSQSHPKHLENKRQTTYLLKELIKLDELNSRIVINGDQFEIKYNDSAATRQNQQDTVSISATMGSPSITRSSDIVIV
jgi:hypothetical protein